MRTSGAWVMWASMLAGCGLQNPTVRTNPDVLLVASDDGASEADRADAVDSDFGNVGDTPEVAIDVAAEDATVEPADAPTDALDGSWNGDATDASLEPDAAADAAEDTVRSDAPAAPSDASAQDASAPDVVIPPRWSVTTADARTTSWRGSSPGDSFDSVSCAADQVLVGLTTWSSYYVSGLAPWCAPLRADGSLGPASRGDRRGGSTGGGADDLCPAGQVIVRFTINSGEVIDRLQATCASLAPWLARREFGAALRSHGDSIGGSRAQDDCPAGYVGGGFDLRSGDYLLIERVRSLRLRCVALSDH